MENCPSDFDDAMTDESFDEAAARACPCVCYCCRGEEERQPLDRARKLLTAKPRARPFALSTKFPADLAGLP
ncbi:MAG: hypothetical protein EXQ97_06270 [Alphaproteobacteria bacterium]|nr:hypothetical protein [Alphaproteobacteria bacterium]